MTINRRNFITTTGGLALGAMGASSLKAEDPATGNTKYASKVPQPKGINKIMFSCKYTMVAGKKEEIEKRLSMVKEAGYDGIDFDQCGSYTVDEIRNAAYNTGIFVHSAINHAHWDKRFTSKKKEDVEAATRNLEHCIRVSHACGGSGVLLVVGHQNDGTKKEVEDRARENLQKLLPLAGALGQAILFENVWNGMNYKHGGPTDQTAEDLAGFIDSFKTPLIGSYFDIGNHHRYGNMGDWIRTLGHRIQKFDLKGYNKAKALETKKDGQWRDITKGDIDWADIRKALDDINFHGWTTAEVGGGDVKRLSIVLGQMKKALLGQ